jgi:hypothetical protein
MKTFYMCSRRFQYYHRAKRIEDVIVNIDADTFCSPRSIQSGRENHVFNF